MKDAYFSIYPDTGPGWSINSAYVFPSKQEAKATMKAQGIADHLLQYFELPLEHKWAPSKKEDK